MIYIEYENDMPEDAAMNEMIESVINEAVDYEACPYEVEVNVILTDNANIQELNREHRNIDRATDVLSFPMVAYDQPADFSDIEETQGDCFNPDTGELMLGDIVISTERAAEQAKEYGHSYRREIAFLVAHSMLHLMGYDHMEDEERAVMERKQEEILQNLGITREMA